MFVWTRSQSYSRSLGKEPWDLTFSSKFVKKYLIYNLLLLNNYKIKYFISKTKHYFLNIFLFKYINIYMTNIKKDLQEAFILAAA